MAKGKRERSGAVDRAAEAVGHALGSVAGTIESLQAQHPHPLEEAREALAAGQETLAAVASEAGTHAAAMITKAKDVARRTKKVATLVRPKRTPAVDRDAHGTERGEAREESRQAPPEDREPGGALEALARPPPSIADVVILNSSTSSNEARKGRRLLKE